MTPAYCRMFLDARRILGLSEWDLAQRLATDVGTIRALEQGQLAALPPWSETSRVVTAYLSGLGMDPRPVLHSLAHDLAAVGSTQSKTDTRSVTAGRTRSRGETEPSKRRADVPAAAPQASWTFARAWIGKFGNAPASASRSAQSAIAAGRRAAVRVGGRFGARRDRRDEDEVGDGGFSRHGARWMGRSALVAVACLALAAVATKTSLASSVITAAAAPLPAPVTRAFGKVADFVRMQLAPVRDGLRWIEVEDPRSRRGDKLQTARR